MRVFVFCVGGCMCVYVGVCVCDKSSCLLAKYCRLLVCYVTYLASLQ